MKRYTAEQLDALTAGQCLALMFDLYDNLLRQMPFTPRDLWKHASIKGPDGEEVTGYGPTLDKARREVEKLLPDEPEFWAALRAKGYRVEEYGQQFGYSQWSAINPEGKSIIRGLALSEADAWDECKHDDEREIK